MDPGREEGLWRASVKNREGGGSDDPLRGVDRVGLDDPLGVRIVPGWMTCWW